MLDIYLYACKHVDFFYHVHKLYFGFIKQVTYIFRIIIPVVILSLFYWTHRTTRMVLKYSLVIDSFKNIHKIMDTLSSTSHANTITVLHVLIQFQMVSWFSNATCRLNISVSFSSFY